jgi:hypothetical protein
MPALVREFKDSTNPAVWASTEPQALCSSPVSALANVFVCSLPDRLLRNGGFGRTIVRLCNLAEDARRGEDPIGQRQYRRPSPLRLTSRMDLCTSRHMIRRPSQSVCANRRREGRRRRRLTSPSRKGPVSAHSRGRFAAFGPTRLTLCLRSHLSCLRSSSRFSASDQLR